MSQSLQQRAQAFLAREVPADLDYIPGSIAERVIAMYAKNGKLDQDDELAELVMLAAMETPAAAERQKGKAAREYLEASAAILHAILDEG